MPPEPHHDRDADDDRDAQEAVDAGGNLDAQDDLNALAAVADRAGDQPTRASADRLIRGESPPLIPNPDGPTTVPTVGRTALSWAFAYRTAHADNRPASRITFQPFFESSHDTSVPPPLQTVSADIVDVWAHLAERTQTPYARARLQHLLFAVHRGNGRRRAVDAAQAYLDSSQRWTREQDGIADLRSALSLARAVHDNPLTERVVEAVLTRATAAVTSESPGIIVRYLELLRDRAELPQSFDDLLRQALTAVHDDPWRIDRIHAIRRDRATDDITADLVDTDRVDSWITAASTAEGLIAAGYLKQALTVAEATGRPGLVERAAAALQAIDKDSLGLVTFSASTPIDDEQIDAIINPFVELDDWRDCLTALAFFGPVTGDVEQNRAQVADEARTSVVMSALRHEIIGGDGLPRYAPQDDAGQAEIALCRQEQQLLRGWARFLAEAFNRVARRHGIPRTQELTEHLASLPIVDEETAGVLARALQRYWARDFEGAALTALPRIESLSRSLVLALDAGVYRLQRKERPGQYPGLGVLLGVLKDRGLDESWYRFLTSTFTSPGGANLRNEVAHGFASNIGPVFAAVIIQAALYLAHQEAGATPTPEPGVDVGEMSDQP